MHCALDCPLVSLDNAQLGQVYPRTTVKVFPAWYVLCKPLQHSLIRQLNMRLTGNVRDYAYQENVGDLDFKYGKEYGTVWRQASPLGVGDFFLSGEHD